MQLRGIGKCFWFLIKPEGVQAISLRHGAFKFLLGFLISITAPSLSAAVQEASGLSSKDYLEGEIVQIQKSAQACRFVQSDFSQYLEGVSTVPGEYGKLEHYTIFKKVDGYATPITAIAFLSPKIKAPGKGIRELIIAFRSADSSNYEGLLTCSSTALQNPISYASEMPFALLSLFVDSSLEGLPAMMMLAQSKSKVSNQYLSGVGLWAMTFAENSIKEARHLYGKDNISVIACGHALGGICAQIIGFYGHHKFFVFNSPGIKKILEGWGDNPFVNLGYPSNSRSIDGLNILLGNDPIGRRGEALVKTQSLPYEVYNDQILLNGLDAITKKHINEYITKKMQNLRESLRTLRIRIASVINLSRREMVNKSQHLSNSIRQSSRELAQLKEEQYTECKVTHCKNNWIFHTETCKSLGARISATEISESALQDELATTHKLLNDIDSLPDWQRSEKKLSETLQSLQLFMEQIESSSLSEVVKRLIQLGYDYTKVIDFDREALNKEKKIYVRLRQHSIEAMCDFMDGKMSKKVSPPLTLD
jgi:hypothetical protein